MKYTTKDGKVWDDLTVAETHETKLFSDWISNENNKIIALLPKETMPDGIQSYTNAFLRCLRRVWDAMPYEHENKQYTTDRLSRTFKVDPINERFEIIFRKRLVEHFKHYDVATCIDEIMRLLKLSIGQTHEHCFSKPVHADYAILRHLLRKLVPYLEQEQVISWFDQALTEKSNES